MSAIQPAAGAGGVANLRTIGEQNRSGMPAGDKSRFGSMLVESLDKLNEQHVAADNSIQSLVTGGAENVSGVVLSMAKAEMGFRFMVEMRNRLVETYQELMRMQI